MHVLLLNPPGKLPYGRDYFCSKVTKGGYTEHPVDFLILSGIIQQAGHRISLLDAVCEKLNFSETSKRISELSPDIIIFLSGTASWKEDFEFMMAAKRSSPDLILIGIGDIFLDPNFFHKNDWIDAVILDFTGSDILKYIRGEVENLTEIGFRKNGRIYFPFKIKTEGRFAIPIPRHELFLDKRYTFPFAKSLPFATVLTDYGCPFNCSFCLYPTLGYKARDIEDVFGELRYVHSLGIKELFIKDQSFAANRARAIALCGGMQKIGKFSWTCFLRTDIAEPRLLETMKNAGCHTIMFGVESADEKILKKYKPGINRENIRRAFKLCREMNIDSVGIFIFGFPGEDRESCLKTIKLAKELKCDYASFNLFVPKFETPLRKDLIKSRVVDEDKPQILDQSGIAAVWSNGELSQKELGNLRRLAVRRFYLRPSYLVKNLLRKLHSREEIAMLFRSANFIFKDILRKKDVN